MRQTAKAKAACQTAQQMLEDLIRAERPNAAMKEDLAAVQNELGKLSTRSHKFNSCAGEKYGGRAGTRTPDPLGVNEVL